LNFNFSFVYKSAFQNFKSQVKCLIQPIEQIDVDVVLQVQQIGGDVVLQVQQIGGDV
jgi:hypothetical protein